MVEAAGIEPASLKPSAQMYYKLSRYCLTRLACYRRTAYTRLEAFIYTGLPHPFPSFLLAVDALSP